MIARAWHRLPAILAFLLLAFQAAVPWTARRFVTQDGPSHLYTGVVLKDLLLHPHGAYASVYRLQPEIVPNWSSAILLGTASSIAGADHAEQLLASACIIAGFFAFAYACAALCPGASPWSPLANFLLQNSFLALGLYNFYLGMALCPFVIGFYIRRLGRLTMRRAALLALGLVALFFTHIIAAAVAAMTIIVIELLFDFSSGSMPQAARRIGLLGTALIPLLVLVGLFANTSPEGVQFRPEAARAFDTFPMNLFVTGPGRSGGQELLWPAVFFYMAVAALAMRRDEWVTPRGGVFIAAVLTACLFFLAPDNGFGGQEVKKRLVWVLFILGCLLACSVKRLRPLRIPVSIYTACFLSGTLITLMQTTNSISSATDAYISAMDRIPNGATFVRVYYPLPDIPRRFGFAGIPLAPLFHLDAYAAASRGLVDLSDYQAASGLFPVVYAPAIDTGHRYALWGLENAANKNSANLDWLRNTMPVPIDYVVVVGDETSAEARTTDMTKTLATLDSTMRLIATASPNSFVRVYQRIGAQ